jgi:spore photoproduct lyase
MNVLARPQAPMRPRSWLPKRVLVTRSALAHDHGRAIAERAAGFGIEVVELAGDRLLLGRGETERQTYAQAKSTLAVVVAPPSKLKFRPIAPSADWRVDLAEGCPAHCSYCYLAGSLSGPPVTRVYANLDEIFAALAAYLGKGTITSRSAGRRAEGTTFEASCYTDPLGIEHLTGSLAAAIDHFGRWEADAQLRFTTKFASVEPLLNLAHKGRTRMRVSLNPPLFARFEGGTSPVAARIEAARRMGEAGYPIGLTIAPIIAAEGWREAYGTLLRDCATALGHLPGLTVELITHRFTAGSKQVLEGWYPGSQLDMSGERRAAKRTKFGGEKQVYDAATMRELRDVFEGGIAEKLPGARILYWT